MNRPHRDASAVRRIPQTGWRCHRGMANLGGEEILDCVSGGTCLALSMDETGWDLAGGASFGKTGNLLGHHTAWTLGYEEVTTTLSRVAKHPALGPKLALETCLVQAWARAEIALLDALMNTAQSVTGNRGP